MCFNRHHWTPTNYTYEIFRTHKAHFFVVSFRLFHTQSYFFFHFTFFFSSSLLLLLYIFSLHWHDSIKFIRQIGREKQRGKKERAKWIQKINLFGRRSAAKTALFYLQQTITLIALINSTIDFLFIFVFFFCFSVLLASLEKCVTTLSRPTKNSVMCFCVQLYIPHCLQYVWLFRSLIFNQFNISFAFPLDFFLHSSFVSILF